MTVVMTVQEWRALADYLGNVEFDDRDTLEISSDEDGVRAVVRSHDGTVVDEVEIEPNGET